MTRSGQLALLALVVLSPWRTFAIGAEKEATSAPAAATPSAASAAVEGALEELEIGPTQHRTLRGPDARHQLVVTGRYSSSQLRDFTHAVRYAAAPEGIVSIAPDGLVTPLGDGQVVVTALHEETKLSATIELNVEKFTEEVPIHFPNQIVPIFTKLGCNGGGCHGKSGGQNGFRLSLLGFYPEEDHEYLVKEARGRRVFAASPERSLLLEKAINAVPHGGGQRLDADSHEYRLIRRWMLQGMPYGDRDAPSVASIEVFPRERTLGQHGRQQLAVLAHYTDGAVEDVTRMAQFEPNDKELAETGETGVVRTFDLAGEVGIMVRFQGQVDVFRASVPLGVEVRELPPVRNFIDELVHAKLQKLGIPPSGVCDDATFIRRVTVDIAGRLPTADEARAFAADENPQKRARLIERLLSSLDYAYYFANKWSAVLRNKRDNGRYTRGTFAFHGWIRDSLYHNRPYDEFVRSIVAATGEVDEHPPVTWYRSVPTTEQQLEDSAQLFLGLRIQCARCHHHPFERWSQKDYYGYAAFFSRVGRKEGPNGLNRNDEPRIVHDRGRASARNPRTQETLRPTGLGGQPLDLAPDEDPREALVDWMADPSNAFFAPALVNRYWKHFFGRGLVEPEDDMRVTNPPSHPELLEALAKHFVDSGFDLKQLVRTICNSTTYQLDSLPNEHNARDQQNYSRFYPKRLTAEVLYDAVNQLAGATPGFAGLPRGTRAVELPDTGVNNYFLTVFGRPMADSACECERTQDANLAQSLHLLNSSDLQKKLADSGGRAASLARDTDRTDAEKVRELYYWAYARPPAQDELDLALAYLAKGAEKTELKQRAYEDVIWALMNTKEFLFNH